MDIVLLAVIGLVLLLGLVAIGVGNKGWNWGTVAAAVLLLLAATGYLYLAARLAERERSWRAVIAKNQAEIERITGSGGPGGAAAPTSLAALRNQRDRWTRALAFVDTWHGRSWGLPPKESKKDGSKKASLNPPRGGQAGTISIEMASAESEAAPLAAGAEVAVFDNAKKAEDGGQFLGLFRVQAVKANKGDEYCQLTIVPAAYPGPVSESDTKLWTDDYDDVTVYESLPVDRWLAFYKTTDDAAEDAPGDNGTSSGRWRPQPKKTAAEDPLKNLEAEMEALQLHGQQVPEDQWSQLGQQLTDREILPGRYWAVVTFTKNVRFTKKDAFTLDASAQAEAGSGNAEDGSTPVEVPIDDVAADADGAGDDGSKGPTDADPTAAAITKQFTAKRFKEGETAEFDLQTALDLQNDKQFVRITSVIERRPLTDPLTAIRGTEFGKQDADGKPLRSEGIDAIRQAILVEKASIEQAIARVTSSQANVQAQSQALATTKQQLDSDLTSWEKDLAAATATATAFDDRFRAATIELSGMETSIVRLGKELGEAWAVLTETIEQASR